MPVNVRRHLVGDIHLPKGTPLAHRLRFNRLLRKTAAAARDCKQVWIVNSGYRSYAEQAELYDQYLHHGGTLAAKPGTSNHEGGRALDVSVRTKRGKVPVGVSARRRAALRKYGLCLPVPGELWHVEQGTRFA